MNTHMRRRHHGGHSNGMNNNRRHQGRSGGGNYQNRPRKNYAVLREKYLNQAKDAMASGDRVLAEYYLQHADHCYRMQQEFLAERAERQQHQPQANADEGQQQENNDDNGDNNGDNGGSEELDVNLPNNSNVLPAFLTRQVPPQGGAAPAPQNWEEE